LGLGLGLEVQHEPEREVARVEGEHRGQALQPRGGGLAAQAEHRLLHLVRVRG
jgi:hypothetical protein